MHSRNTSPLMPIAEYWQVFSLSRVGISRTFWPYQNLVIISILATELEILPTSLKIQTFCEMQ